LYAIEQLRKHFILLVGKMGAASMGFSAPARIRRLFLGLRSFCLLLDRQEFRSTGQFAAL
jgi:hypothetical protein